MTRAERIQASSPHLVADVTLYAPSEGGRSTEALPGWGCPCMVSQMEPLVGYDAFPQLGETPLEPGARRRLAFVFRSPDGAEVMRTAGRFYLWEGGFIGEARIVDEGR